MLWLKRFVTWIFAPRLAWVVVTVIAVAIYVAFFALGTEKAIRVAGLCLQLLGLIAAAIGIRDTRRLFGRPSLLGMVRSWIVNFPRITTRTVHLGAQATISMHDDVSAEVWEGAGDQPTIETRLAAAEKNLLATREYFHKWRASADRTLRELKVNILSEQAARELGDRQLHVKIEASSADGLHLAAAGVAWVLVGTVLSTVPNELLAFLQCMVLHK
jgi:hypothetical protein